ncbi:usg protein [Novosphingobium sp. G106]|uniref:usg protein n=1 Tax=Novosphingobium sp. G106 TaxID=2849500 RepID=UPI001C2D43C9|nr:usg protein [Novosphingobium sp. G106]MBV1690370.1 usg protein [Novosphingobium sp. G106]
MAGSDLLKQLQGSALTTAEIHYFLPDYPSLLQLFIWQDYDEAPDFPALHLFLGHWHREIDGILHSVRVAHRRDVGPPRWRNLDAIRPI